MKQQITEPTPDQTSETICDRSERLIDAAMSLTRAIELLTTAELSREAKPSVSGGIDFYQEVTRFQIALIREALRFSKGHQVKAAALLRLNPTTLNSKLKNYKIDPKSFRSDLSVGSLGKSDVPELYKDPLVDNAGPTATA